MKKLFIATFMFVSTFTSNVFADGHAIKMGIILGFTGPIESLTPVSYTHLRAHETLMNLVCRLLLEKRS